MKELWTRGWAYHSCKPIAGDLLGKWWMYYFIYQFTWKIRGHPPKKNCLHKEFLKSALLTQISPFPLFPTQYEYLHQALIFSLIFDAKGINNLSFNKFYWFIMTKLDFFSLFPANITITTTTSFKVLVTYNCFQNYLFLDVGKWGCHHCPVLLMLLNSDTVCISECNWCRLY